MGKWLTHLFFFPAYAIFVAVVVAIFVALFKAFMAATWMEVGFAVFVVWASLNVVVVFILGLGR